MSSEGSITKLLHQLDPAALSVDQRRAQEAIWERFFGQLVVVARQKLGGAPRRVADEEDVVLSAMDSFYRRAADGRFPELQDRHGLWPLLVMITARKAFNAARDQRAQKRGGGQVRGDSIAVNAAESGAGFLAEMAVCDEPTPQFAIEMAEQCQRLLDALPDSTMRRIAELKLQGYSTSELAGALKISPRTIERRLRSIRDAWAQSEEET